MPAYIVFGDATLRGIALTEPTSREALGTVSGVGEKKLEAYGDAVLAIVRGEEPAPAIAAAAQPSAPAFAAAPAYDDEPPPLTDDDAPPLFFD